MDSNMMVACSARSSPTSATPLSSRPSGPTSSGAYSDSVLTACIIRKILRQPRNVSQGSLPTERSRPPGREAAMFLPRNEQVTGQRRDACPKICGPALSHLLGHRLPPATKQLRFCYDQHLPISPLCRLVLLPTETTFPTAVGRHHDYDRGLIERRTQILYIYIYISILALLRGVKSWHVLFFWISRGPCSRLDLGWGGFLVLAPGSRAGMGTNSLDRTIYVYIYVFILRRLLLLRSKPCNHHVTRSAVMLERADCSNELLDWTAWLNGLM